MKRKDQLNIRVSTNGKFEEDQINYQSSEYVIVLVGLVLNKVELCHKYSIDWHQTIIKLFELKGERFFEELEGSFAGFLYHKSSDTSIVFNDYIGSKYVYYTNQEGKCIISTNLPELYKKKDSLSLNIDSAYMLLTYGYMLNHFTLAQDVYKLEFGQYIVIHSNNVDFKNKVGLPLEYCNIQEEDAIVRLDSLFNKAVKKQFEKDVEYDYNHLTALSGGLDSRMTSAVAHELGYIKQTNYTFSQSGYLDDTISYELSRDLKHDRVFLKLDGGDVLKNFEEITEITGGQVIYYGLSHLYHMVQHKLNLDSYGIVHTGQLGDVIVGTYYTHTVSPSMGAYSTTFIDKLAHYKLAQNEPLKQEQSVLIQRGINGILYSNLVSQLHSETYSPFYDREFMNFCLSIPVEMRMNHHLYKRWILEKHSYLAKYKWEKTGTSIKNKFVFPSHMGRKLPLRFIPGIINKKLSLKKHSSYERYHMFPLEYYYKTNQSLKIHLNEFFVDHIDLLAEYAELQSDCRYLFDKGKVLEKIQVITLLSAVKRFFT